jgi:hypothetical protein
MIVRYLGICALGLALGAGCVAQDPTTPPAGQGGGQGQGNGQGQGDGRERRGGGMMGSMMGRGVMGTVTEVAPDHFLLKNGANEIYTIHYSANTRIMKQQPPAPGSNAGAGGGAGGQDGPMGGGRGGNPPVPIKATDIKVGDAIAAGGETDDAAKSVGAVFVMLLDPSRAAAMKEMQANFGKTWLMGKVTAISETKVTLHSGVDNADHTFVADENTTFRRRRDPITLGDVQVGDNLRVDGSVKDGQFLAGAVNVMVPPANGGPARRQGAAPPQ